MTWYSFSNILIYWYLIFFCLLRVLRRCFFFAFQLQVSTSNLLISIKISIFILFKIWSPQRGSHGHPICAKESVKVVEDSNFDMWSRRDKKCVTFWKEFNERIHEDSLRHTVGIKCPCHGKFHLLDFFILLLLISAPVPPSIQLSSISVPFP